MDEMAAGDRPDYNSELTSWLHSFTPAINYYLREELGFDTDLQYNMFGPVYPWDRSGDQDRPQPAAGHGAEPLPQRDGAVGLLRRGD